MESGGWSSRYKEKEKKKRGNRPLNPRASPIALFNAYSLSLMSRRDLHSASPPLPLFFSPPVRLSRFNVFPTRAPRRPEWQIRMDPHRRRAAERVSRTYIRAAAHFEGHAGNFKPTGATSSPPPSPALLRSLFLSLSLALLDSREINDLRLH